jgi:hypothetical protein
MGSRSGDISDVVFGVFVGVGVTVLSMNLFLVALYIIVWASFVWWKDRRLVPWLAQRREKRVSES